jgi:hypothetical protein
MTPREPKGAISNILVNRPNPNTPVPGGQQASAGAQTSGSTVLTAAGLACDTGGLQGPWHAGAARDAPALVRGE